MDEHFEVEYRYPYTDDWLPLSDKIGGIGNLDLVGARKMVAEDLPVIAEHDGFFKGLTYRIVKVSREVVT